MTWSYLYPSQTPAGERDKVRFLIGDTLECDPLVQDEEIDFALSEFSDIRLASALVLRTIAARFGRQNDLTVGSVSVSGSNAKVQGFLKLAQEYDPNGLTLGVAIVLPRFGGLQISEKETFDEDDDAVQPVFRKFQDDIPGGPDGNDS